MSTRIVALLLSLAPALAVADNAQQEAKVLVGKATKAHEAGDFAGALANLQAAFDKDPQPDLLYAIAQVHAKLGQCTEAITFYEQFLATSPSEAAATDTREAIDVCKAQLAPPPPPPVVQAPPPPPPPAPTLPWYRDAIGAGLVGGGVLAVTVGAIVYASARGDLNDAESATDLSTYNDLVDGAAGKRVLSVVLVGGGAALIGYGVMRIVTKQPSTEEPRLALVPTSEGGMITFGGAF